MSILLLFTQALHVYWRAPYKLFQTDTCVSGAQLISKHTVKLSSSI